jgi:hypothetical protein
MMLVPPRLLMLPDRQVPPPYDIPERNVAPPFILNTTPTLLPALFVVTVNGTVQVSAPTV